MKAQTYSDRVSSRMEDLEKREAKLFEISDRLEKKISETIGNNLTPEQFLKIQIMFGELARCKEQIEGIQERMDDVAQAI